jgi:Ribonuclease T2 family
MPAVAVVPPMIPAPIFWCLSSTGLPLVALISAVRTCSCVRVLFFLFLQFSLSTLSLALSLSLELALLVYSPPHSSLLTRSCNKTLVEEDFTIHGFWPENYDGSWPQYCSPDNFSYNMIRNLTNELDYYWPDLKVVLTVVFLLFSSCISSSLSRSLSFFFLFLFGVCLSFSLSNSRTLSLELSLHDSLSLSLLCAFISHFPCDFSSPLCLLVFSSSIFLCAIFLFSSPFPTLPSVSLSFWCFIAFLSPSFC